MAERIAAMLNGEEDPEIVRLRKIIEDTNNVLFDGCHYDEEEIDHEVQQHNANASDIAKKLAKINQKALDLVSAVVMDLVGG